MGKMKTHSHRWWITQPLVMDYTAIGDGLHSHRRWITQPSVMDYTAIGDGLQPSVMDYTAIGDGLHSHRWWITQPSAMDYTAIGDGLHSHRWWITQPSAMDYTAIGDGLQTSAMDYFHPGPRLASTWQSVSVSYKTNVFFINEDAINWPKWVTGSLCSIYSLSSTQFWVRIRNNICGFMFDVITLPCLTI